MSKENHVEEDNVTVFWKLNWKGESLKLSGGVKV